MEDTNLISEVLLKVIPLHPWYHRWHPQTTPWNDLSQKLEIYSRYPPVTSHWARRSRRWNDTNEKRLSRNERCWHPKTQTLPHAPNERLSNWNHLLKSQPNAEQPNKGPRYQLEWRKTSLHPRHTHPCLLMISVHISGHGRLFSTSCRSVWVKKAKKTTGKKLGRKRRARLKRQVDRAHLQSNACDTGLLPPKPTIAHPHRSSVRQIYATQEPHHDTPEC